jgi:hypothetical protein
LFAQCIKFLWSIQLHHTNRIARTTTRHLNHFKRYFNQKNNKSIKRKGLIFQHTLCVHNRRTSSAGSTRMQCEECATKHSWLVNRRMSSTATTTTTTTTSSINAVPDTITTTATPPDSASTVPAAASTPKKKSKHHQHHQHQRRVREDGDLNGDDVPAMMHSRSSGDIAALATGRVNVRRRRRTRKDSATTALLVCR